MLVRNAELEDMKQLGHIMAVSFRTAFADFVSQQTMDACAQEDNCAAMLEGIYREGKMHFLIGQNSGMLVWQKAQDSAEIVAIHSFLAGKLGHRLGSCNAGGSPESDRQSSCFSVGFQGKQTGAPLL